MKDIENRILTTNNLRNLEIWINKLSLLQCDGGWSHLNFRANGYQFILHAVWDKLHLFTMMSHWLNRRVGDLKAGLAFQINNAVFKINV